MLIPSSFGMSNPAIMIQQATLLHAEAVSELFDQYIQEAGKQSNLPKVRSYITQGLSLADSKIFMAFKDNFPIGFIQIFKQFGATSMRPIWYIQDLFVKHVKKSPLAC